MFVNPKILELLKKNFNINRLQSIGLDVQGRTLTITIDLETGAKKNMQIDSACFEGWATILKTYFIDKHPEMYEKVELSCPNITMLNEIGKDNPPLMRFLYRVLRFNEQYKWFTMDDELANIIDSFNFKGCFVNNYSEKEQEQKDKSESEIEHLLIKKKH